MSDSRRYARLFLLTPIEYSVKGAKHSIHGARVGAKWLFRKHFTYFVLSVLVSLGLTYFLQSPEFSYTQNYVLFVFFLLYLFE